MPSGWPNPSSCGVGDPGVGVAVVAALRADGDAPPTSPTPDAASSVTYRTRTPPIPRRLEEDAVIPTIDRDVTAARV